MTKAASTAPGSPVMDQLGNEAGMVPNIAGWKLVSEEEIARILDEGWQPRSSAPTDGTHILACGGNYSERGWTFKQMPPAVIHYFPDPQEPGFYLSNGGSPDEHPYPFKFWKHLGDPPETAWRCDCGHTTHLNPCPNCKTLRPGSRARAVLSLLNAGGEPHALALGKQLLTEGLRAAVSRCAPVSPSPENGTTTSAATMLSALKMAQSLLLLDGDPSCLVTISGADPNTVADTYRAISDAIHAASVEPHIPTAHGWRNIGSAPKDGTTVLLYWPHWRATPVIGHWMKDSPAKNKWCADCALTDGPLPTHWQPLPAAPSASKEG